MIGYLRVRLSSSSGSRYFKPVSTEPAAGHLTNDAPEWRGHKRLTSRDGASSRYYGHVPKAAGASGGAPAYTPTKTMV